ncbi:kinase-like domain-containing protein [Mycena epipterygia]|nr:kinase-like domain-containing protein [Mycena epipterygia]
MLDGKPHVAKRFFEVGNGLDCVSSDENATQLENEIIRLKQGQWFLDQFYARAEETDTEVSNNFVFSSGLLVREVIEQAGRPSPASGVSMESFLNSLDKNPDSAIIWLLEPLRGSAIERWSGTLKHPNHQNKPGQTIDAFMHFSHVYSQGTLVFADIQGMHLYGRSRGGNSGWILFDIMTHTYPGTSGVGDHGEYGIDAILADHICDRMCHGLDMGEENMLPKKTLRPKRKSSTKKKSD